MGSIAGAGGAVRPPLMKRLSATWQLGSEKERSSVPMRWCGAAPVIKDAATDATIIAPRRPVVIDAIGFGAREGRKAVQLLLIRRKDAEKVGTI